MEDDFLSPRHLSAVLRATEDRNGSEDGQVTPSPEALEKLAALLHGEIVKPGRKDGSTISERLAVDYSSPNLLEETAQRLRKVVWSFRTQGRLSERQLSEIVGAIDRRVYGMVPIDADFETPSESCEEETCGATRDRGGLPVLSERDARFLWG